MPDTELFQLVLGLAPPWLVASSSFNVGEKRLELGIDFSVGSQMLCPVCGMLSAVYDSEEKRWRDLDFFQHHAYLVARVPRVWCQKHGVH